MKASLRIKPNCGDVGVGLTSKLGARRQITGGFKVYLRFGRRGISAISHLPSARTILGNVQGTIGCASMGIGQRKGTEVIVGFSASTLHSR